MIQAPPINDGRQYDLRHCNTHHLMDFQKKNVVENPNLHNV